MSVQDYFQTMRQNAERTWGASNMVRPTFGTIGKISQAQAVGSFIPTEQTWISNPQLKPSPPVHEVTVQQVFIEPAAPPSQVDEDGDVVMIDAQDIVPE